MNSYAVGVPCGRRLVYYCCSFFNSQQHDNSNLQDFPSCYLENEMDKFKTKAKWSEGPDTITRAESSAGKGEGRLGSRARGRQDKPAGGPEVEEGVPHRSQVVREDGHREGVRVPRLDGACASGLGRAMAGRLTARRRGCGLWAGLGAAASMGKVSRMKMCVLAQRKMPAARIPYA